jgi:hypothetical protein
MDLRIGERSVDQNAVAGIGDIGELSDIVAAQQIVKIVPPSARPDAFVDAGCSLKSSVRDYCDGRMKPSATTTANRRREWPS